MRESAAEVYGRGAGCARRFLGNVCEWTRSRARAELPERGWQEVRREILVRDGSDEAEEGGGTDGGEAGVAARGPGAGVVAGGIDFDPDGDAVEDEATGDFCEKRDEVGCEGVGGIAEKRGGELSGEGTEKRLDLFGAIIGDEDGERTEEFLAEAGVVLEGFGIG